MPVGRFLAAILAVIWDDQTDKYLLLRRSPQKDVGAGWWECPTGRVDQGENFEQALYREVWEELQVRPQVEFLIGTTHFYRGAPSPDTEMLGIVYGCTLPDPAAIQTGAEHDDLRWMSAAEAIDFLPGDHWLAWCICRAEHLRRAAPPELREIFRREGFEIAPAA
jgi:8-oxo-dGTP diphosphatase